MEERSKLTKYSEYLNVSPNMFDKFGIYDGYLFIDSPLYVHPHLLSKTTIAEFKDSNSKINKHFELTVALLAKTKDINDTSIVTKMLLSHFNFSEPQGIGLGTSNNSIAGNGLAGDTAKQSLQKIKEINDLDIKEPEIYRLLGIVQNNIGVDRISDMICNIIYEDILLYTQNMLDNLGLKVNEIVIYNDKEYHIMKRPNGSNLLFLPKELLSEIPIAYDIDDICDIISENKEIREYLGRYIENANRSNLKKMKKETLSSIIIGNKAMLEKLIELLKKETIEPYDFSSDILDIKNSVQVMNMFLFNNSNILDFKAKKKLSLFEIVGEMINSLKHAIENLGLNEELYYINKKGERAHKNEITSHRMFILILETAKRVNNYDYSFEAKAGNGQIEFKITNNKETVLVEFKLNSNNLVHGYQEQLPIYMTRFKTDVAYYVIIKVLDNKAIDNFYKRVGAISNKIPVICIDALPKKSPSETGRR